MPDVLATLALLGNSPSDIAAALRERGIKGQMWEAVRCPLARFLSDELGQRCLVSAPWIVVGGKNEHSTPASVAEFIRHFDAGKWPELVEEEYVDV